MMTLPERILSQLQAADSTRPLWLVVGCLPIDMTQAFLDLAQRMAYPYINVGLVLSPPLLAVAEPHRPIHVRRLLAELMDEHAAKVMLLDHIELLFNPVLKQDPLRLLQRVNRNCTLVVAWPGQVEPNHLIYAEPNHPEYRRYPMGGLNLIE